jgi:para-nitrobenzyl esterase
MEARTDKRRPSTGGRTGAPSTPRDRDLVVDTTNGKVRGGREASVCFWLGIPYAAPPVEELRFRAPHPPRAWAGVRDAVHAGPAAVQPPPLPKLPTFPGGARAPWHSEDCLTLNVWSPAADGGKRPVLVWIHGGGFETGAGAFYRGQKLAGLGDIVVVTINYRLGPFGFLNLRGLFADVRLDHNVGLLDQVATLRWVKANIEGFGGDPDRVTIAGESAGGGSVLMLMQMDETKGLFRAGIAQSPSGPNLNDSWEASLDTAQEFAGVLGIAQDNLDDLWTLPPERLVAAMQVTKQVRPEGLTTRPYYDGAVLPASIEDARAKPAHPIPLLIGTNRDEHRLFTTLRVPMLPLSRVRLTNTITRSFGTDAAATILAAYPPDTPGRDELGTDLNFAMPAAHVAERHSRIAPVWRYRLDYPSPVLNIGAAHGLDLFLLFPFPRVLRRVVLGPDTAELEALSMRMKRYWIAFVRDATPGADWPTYDVLTRNTLLFKLQDQVVGDPERERREVWAGRDAMVH